MSDRIAFAAAFITGHSLPGCTGLSPAQINFQRRSAIGAGSWLPFNFPWHESHPYPARVPLLRASLGNLRHYHASRKPGFREAHREGAIRMLSRFDTIVLLSGSCGLELLANLDLPLSVRSRLHVFACGPVSRTVPQTASLETVQGDRDLLTKWFHPRATHRISCGHMGYLEQPETLLLFDQFCQTRAPAAPSRVS